MNIMQSAISINRTFENVQHSPTLRMNNQVVQQRRKNQKISHLAFGQSPFPAPQIFQDVLADSVNQNHYLPARGFESLLQSIAHFHQQIFDDKLTSDDVFIGPGSKELIFQLLMMLDGPLLVPTPSWVSYEPQAKILNKPTHRLKTHFEDGYLLTPETLEQACKEIGHKQKILILNTPSNPTGRLYDNARLQAIAEVCRKHQVLVISDEIYALLSFEQFDSIKSHYPEGTFVTSGISKAFSGGGYRLGYCITPTTQVDLKRRWEVLISETYSCVSTPIQLAAHSMYSAFPEVLPYIRKCTLILETICHYTYAFLKRLEINCLKPQGGFYLFPDFNHYKKQLSQKNITTSFELADHLLNHYQVAVLPGSAFYMPDDHLSVRIAPVDFDGRNLIRQSFNNQQLSTPEIFNQHFSSVLRGLKGIETLLKNLKS